MKYHTYLTIYRGNDMPKFYIGSTSTKRLSEGYRGSVLSKEYSRVWSLRQEKNPELFKTVILTTHDTREDAYEKEHFLHKSLSVVSNPLYINKSYADGSGRFGGGFKGKSHSEEHKAHISKTLKGRTNTWTPKERPEHAKKMQGNQFAKGNKNPEQAKKMQGNQLVKNTIWWNNGKVNKRSAESPGSDFVAGRLPFTHKSMHPI